MTYLRPIETTDADPADLLNGDRQRSSRRSRRKAWRDGFAAQTVIGGLEDDRSYRAFERAIVASFGPRSAIELELIHRLASLFWRLRRASAIETGLFGLQIAIGHEGQTGLPCILRHPVKSVPRINGQGQFAPGYDDWRDPKISGHGMRSRGVRQSADKSSKSLTMARSFLHLAKLGPSLLERTGAHEARLWRQAAQTIWILDALRRPPPPTSRRPLRKPVAHDFWDRDRW
jgi:hypothetical protein